MEEEDELSLLDYRSPKGQLIKLLEQKIKKPEIDDTLGKVLDQFAQLTNEQTTFLDNGIFHMNFAEDALLLQSCGQYYAKRVDKLWEELLQFHTRMVKYDEETAKHCTDSGKREARKLELAKLEERLNRGKRKKIKLTEPETEIPQNGTYVFDVDLNAGPDLFDRPNLLEGEEEEEQALPPFEHNFEIFDDWDEIHRLDAIERKKRGSVVVSQYNKQKYRLRPYPIPYGEDIIYDWEDPEEFNTRLGRLISVQHIRHLFEYNDRCLLPDEDFTIAKLRFGYVLKKKWLIQNKIDPDAPYETYKEEYEKYQREYFENEKRKIQNMPQRNSEDLMKFYKVLEKKEHLARQAQDKLRKLGVKNLPEITFESLILDPLKEGYQGDYDPYIPVDDETQPEGSVQIPTDGDHEVELSNFFVGLPKLPDTSAQPEGDKLRSDSGYFDGGFEADDESDHEDNTNVSVPGTDTPFEFDNDNTENKGEETAETNALDKATESSITEIEVTDESSIPIGGEVEVTDQEFSVANIVLEASGEGSVITSMNESEEKDTSILLEDTINSTEHECSCVEEQDDAFANDSMNREIREFVKLGTVDENFNYSVLENSFFQKTDDMVMILYNKGEEDLESVGEDSHLDTIIALGRFEKQMEKKSRKNEKKDVLDTKNKDKKQAKEKEESKKRKLEKCKDDDPPPKRRKLTVKQIEKLRKSLIEPVKETKWESFFSMNYQTEAGEGEISRIDYETASEDEDDAPADIVEDETEDHEDQDEDKIEEPNDANVSGYHSDHDVSYASDHDCHPETPPLPLLQDSGIEIMDTSTNSVNDVLQATEKETEPPKETTSVQESGIVEFSNIDLIAELSKNTGISREELEKQKPAEKPELSPYEQQREKVRERVAEWKEHITPKLKKLDEHDFDIHEYGSKIMDKISENESKSFSELVSGKSSAEVVRYFISSLQLANTMNVEICGAKKGQLSNETFKLKLLSKERYHEHLQEYQAPSEEGLRDKLKKVKEIRMQNKMQAKQSHTKRRATDDTINNQNHIQHFKPQSIMKRGAGRPKAPLANSSNNSQFTLNAPSPRKRIKILNYNIINSAGQQTINSQQLPMSLQTENFNFQPPSTSWQADTLDHWNQLGSATSDITSPIAVTPTRSSIDSGFMPSCDEDTFLDQLDQLQQTTDIQLRSTPVKPRKVLRVSFARDTNF